MTRVYAYGGYGVGRIVLLFSLAWYAMAATIISRPV